MVDREQLTLVYKQNLENDIIKHIAEIEGIDLRRAFDIYYSSKLAEQILEGKCGIENMDAKYLAEDLIENESLLSKLDEALDDVENGRVQTVKDAWKEIDAE